MIKTKIYIENYLEMAAEGRFCNYSAVELYLKETCYGTWF